MFDKSKQNKENAIGKTNRIVEGTIITGDVSSETDFRLDGKLIGNFKSTGKLVIGPSASIVGDVEAGNVDIEGSFEGKLNIKGLLSLKSKSSVKGEIVVGKLSVEPGADVTATCKMQNTAGTKSIKAAKDVKSA